MSSAVCYRARMANEQVNGSELPQEPQPLADMGEVGFIEALKTASVCLPSLEGPALVVSSWAPGMLVEVVKRAAADDTFGERACKAVAIHQMKMGQVAASMLQLERIVAPPSGLILPH